MLTGHYRRASAKANLLLTQEATAFPIQLYHNINICEVGGAVLQGLLHAQTSPWNVTELLLQCFLLNVDG